MFLFDFWSKFIFGYAVHCSCVGLYTLLSVAVGIYQDARVARFLRVILKKLTCVFKNTSTTFEVPEK